MASSMTMTASFFGGAIAAKPAKATTRRGPLAVRASMDSEKESAAESSNTRQGIALAAAAAAAVSSVAKVATAGDAKNQIVGGWTPQDPKKLEFFHVATFAVSEHNKEKKDSLVLGSVFWAETQVVAGTNYKVFFRARDERFPDYFNNYEAIVFSQAAPTILQPTYFQELK